MPIASSDIQYRLSGGASNSVATQSLGGAKSVTAAGVSIFDNVSAAEAGAGRVEYRCVYIHNGNSSQAMADAVAWVNSDTPSTSTDIAIGLGTSGMNGTEQSVGSETSAPSGVTFTAATSKAAGLALGSIPAGQHRAIWIRRTVNAGTAAVGSDPFTIRVECEAGT